MSKKVVEGVGEGRGFVVVDGGLGCRGLAKRVARSWGFENADAAGGGG
jgi:hypothetical protein